MNTQKKYVNDAKVTNLYGVLNIPMHRRQLSEYPSFSVKSVQWHFASVC